jgi:NAD(P)-dependent dehydrogenase (short-subunit alcohol dehydrogenase family)
MLTLTKALGNEWAKHNITVNAIAPGYFPSEITAPYIDTEAFKNLRDLLPFRQARQNRELDGIAIFRLGRLQLHHGTDCLGGRGLAHCLINLPAPVSPHL